MRTIKFRLIKDNKVISTQELKPNGIIDCPVEWDIACQFTGLFDKQGKEIYEGDLLDECEDKEFVYKVGFRDGYFTITDVKTGYDKLGIWNVHMNMEIIGNIYENLEFLKKAGEV